MNIFNSEESFRAAIEADVMGEAQTASVVEATAGFSGREIAKLMIAVQGSIYASPDGVLKSDMIDNVVAIKVAEHKVKLEMTGRGAADCDIVGK